MRRGWTMAAAALLTAAAAIVIAGCKSGGSPGPTGYWMFPGRVWVGEQQPQGEDWYTPGSNQDGVPFWIKRGSDIEQLLRRHGRQN